MKNKIKHSGLNESQVLENRKKYGDNTLTPPPKVSLWSLYIEKFEDPIVRVLLVASFLSLIISFIHWEFAETIGIILAIILSTSIGFWFEVDANRRFDILNKISDDVLIKVIRDSNVCEIPKKDIVVGDIVILEIGDEIVADGILLESYSLQVDESCLTGELICDKSVEDINTGATYPSNEVLRGTKVMNGHAVMEVSRIGDDTEYGKLANSASSISSEKTPLNKQLDKLAKLIGVVGSVLALLTFLVLFFKDIANSSFGLSSIQLGSVFIVLLFISIASVRVWLPIIYDGMDLLKNKDYNREYFSSIPYYKYILTGLSVSIIILFIGFCFNINPLDIENWFSMILAEHMLHYFMIAVTLIVVAVPEGLPMSVAISLALSMRKMLKKNNLVRKMHACETMGAVNVVCTDKTGTLTENKMKVSASYFIGINNTHLDDSDLSVLVKENISINSTANLNYEDKENPTTVGNPTEGALLHWLYDSGYNYIDLRNSLEIIDQLPFSTENKYMATLVYSSVYKKRILYVKGAPEILIGFAENCKDSRFDYIHESKLIKAKLKSYQQQAMRTLAFAYAFVDENVEVFEDNKLSNIDLILSGIVAISDPLRGDVKDAINICANAGIDVKIVTGDTKDTALEISKQIGLVSESNISESIISGDDFRNLSDEQAKDVICDLKVMCRAKPSDKKRLVELLQSKDLIVSVTGDGTNDAPALNAANVGLSMGSGTAVAKEASDITLIDDAFSSIVTAIMWGRSIYHNIQRFLLFQLTINFVALSIVFIGAIIGHDVPLTITQMLWVNLIMDTFTAAALASLPVDKAVMNEQPRDNNRFIVTKKMKNNILAFGAFFIISLFSMMILWTRSGDFSVYDLTRFFTVFVMLQFWNMFNAKVFLTNRSAFTNIHKEFGFTIVVLLILLGQFIIVSFGGEVFRTVPLSLKDWLLIIASTSIILWIPELYRLIQRNK